MINLSEILVVWMAGFTPVFPRAKPTSMCCSKLLIIPIIIHHYSSALAPLSFYLTPSYPRHWHPTIGRLQPCSSTWHKCKGWHDPATKSAKYPLLSPVGCSVAHTPISVIFCGFLSTSGETLVGFLIYFKSFASHLVMASVIALLSVSGLILSSHLEPLMSTASNYFHSSKAAGSPKRHQTCATHYRVGLPLRGPPTSWLDWRLIPDVIMWGKSPEGEALLLSVWYKL